MEGEGIVEKPQGTNFVWSKLNDTLFCGEILLYEPFKFKVRSVERKKAWEMIADNLNAIEDPKFRVTARSVRDRYAYLTTRKSTQLKDVERASGIAVVETELDVLLEEILEKEKEAKLAFEDKKKEADDKEAKDKLSAQEMRQKAMERMSQKKKNNLEEDESGPKKKKARKSSQELFEFFEEKMSKTHAYKKEKLQVKLKEQEAIDKREKERNERFDKVLQQQNDNMMAMMGQQQQQLQQLQTMFMAQQQQQTQALMAILGNNAKK